MFPHLRDVNDFKHILWDHLAIMSNFKLEVDYPYEVLKKENLYTRPPQVPYKDGKITYRHYGQTLEKLIYEATKLEEGEEKELLIRMIANQMKKSYLLWNKDSVDDRKIFYDLAELSAGKIVRNEETIKLADSSDLIEAAPRINKKNKKNHQRK